MDCSSGKKLLKNGFAILFVLFAVLKLDVSATEQHKINRMSLKAGESVTLYTGLIKKPNDVMRWSLNHALIAKITGDQNQSCTEDQCKEKFKGRLKLDLQTGSLTITKTRTTDAGDYQLQINSSSFSLNRSFGVNIAESDVKNAEKEHNSGCVTEIIVSVIVGLPVTMALFALVKYCLCRMLKEKRQKYGLEYVLKLVGQSIVLKNEIEVETDDDLIWRFGDNNLIAQINKETGVIKVFDEAEDERFLDRLDLDHQTGSLTIRNSRTTDSGYYKLEINRRGKKICKRFSVTVFASNEEQTLLPEEIKAPLK